MITSINEFFFSDHYLYDKDARFIERVKKATVLNDFKDSELANTRFKKAMYYYGLEALDKISSTHSPIAIVFGNIWFKVGGKNIKAEIKIPEGREGNLYVAVIKDQTVVTLLLFPFDTTNEEIVQKIQDHDGTDVKRLYNNEGNPIAMEGKARKPIFIDLDISDQEFAKQYPAPLLKNNPYTKKGGGLSELEIFKIEDELKHTKTDKVELSPQIIPQEFLSKEIVEKEFVIATGDTIYVPYPGGDIKEKTIRELIIDETGPSRKYSLEFEKTAKIMDLKIGDTFIISPTMKTENLIQLFDHFNLPHDSKLNFIGKIVKFNFYSKKKTGTIPKLGVIIKPTRFFSDIN